MSDHLIGVASLLTGVPGLLEVCLHLGDFVVQRLEAYQKADEAISDTVLKLATYWDLEKAGIENLRKVYATGTLRPEVEERLVQILERLRRLLTKAATLLAKYTPANKTASTDKQCIRSQSEEAVKRLRYILFEEKQLTQLLEQIAEWESLFNKRLVLLAEQESYTTSSSNYSELCSNKAVSMFRMPLMRPESEREGTNYELPLQDYPEDTMRPFEPDLTWKGSDSGVLVSRIKHDIIVERYENDCALNPYDEVVALASKLCSSQADLMHILPCEGFYSRKPSGNTDSSESEYHLVFRFPNLAPESSIYSLRTSLSRPTAMCLNARLKLAIELATAVWYVHSGQMVHKAIRPETIYVVFNEPASHNTSDQRPTIGSLYLGGFSRFRRKALTQSAPKYVVPGAEPISTLKRKRDNDLWAVTSAPSTTLWEEETPTAALRVPTAASEATLRLLYRHPERWGIKASQPFTMLHDIYSLGVVLIEIGSRRSLVAINGVSIRGSWDIRDYMLRAKEALENGEEVALLAIAELVKQALIKLALKHLPYRMGLKYTEVVISCLKGSLGNSKDNSPPLYLGSAYMEKVLEELEQIRL
jgi:hypothetical protein